MKQRILLAAMLSLGAACTSGGDTSAVRSAISACYDEGDPACLESLESPEADDVFDACFEEHADCLGSGDEELCDVLLDSCFDVYDETGDVGDVIGFCYDEAETCTRDLGVDADECLEMLGSCLGSIDEPADAPDAPVVAEVCFDGHIACLESMGDPLECDLLLDACLHAACPPDVPGPGDPCIEAIEECIESAPDMESASLCPAIVDGCYDPDPGLEPCEEEYFLCIEAGDFEELDACEDLLWACEPPPPSGDACFAEYDRCFEEHDFDDAEGTCEEILWSCDFDDPCAESWTEFESCTNEGGAPDECDAMLLACEVPPVDCAAEFEVCLASGEDAAFCEEIRCICDED